AAPPERPAQLRAVSRSFNALIAIGASVGGPEAIETVLAQLPSDAPPVVIVQHMPASFTKQLAKPLEQTSAVPLVEAEDQAEDEQTCVVFGMPCQAITRGGAMHVAPLPQIPEMIFECLGRLESRALKTGLRRDRGARRPTERGSGGAR